jgi:NhaP-type Na+/H+ or K+/H+ antiporter
MAGTILAIGVLVFLAHFFTALFRRTRIPDVLLLMGLGLILGPGLHLVTPQDFGRVGAVMSTLALIVILFESGVTLDPPVLARAVGPTLYLTFPTFFITIALSYAVAVFGIGLPPALGWLAGAILGGVSAAVVIPLIKSLGVKEPLSTALVMESALGDVLSIVVLLGILQGVISGSMAPVRIVGDVIASLSMACVIGVLGGIGWLLVLKKVRQFPNSAFTTLAFVFILYGVADELGYSGAIAAFAFGATLTNYEYLPLYRLRLFAQQQPGRIEPSDISFFNEILFLLKTFFFLYMGASFSFTDSRLFAWAFVLCAGVYGARLIIVRLARGKGDSLEDLVATSLMVPKGLVAAVLASVPVEAGIEGAEVIRDFAYMVILTSITITAVMLPLSHQRLPRGFYMRVFGTAPSSFSKTRPDTGADQSGKQVEDVNPQQIS